MDLHRAFLVRRTLNHLHRQLRTLNTETSQPTAGRHDSLRKSDQTALRATDDHLHTFRAHLHRINAHLQQRTTIDIPYHERHIAPPRRPGAKWTITHIKAAIPYTNHQQRRHAQEFEKLLGPAEAKMTRIQKHLRDLKSELYPPPGNNPEIVALARRLPKMSAKDEDEELLALEYELKALETRLTQNIASLPGRGEDAQGSAKTAGAPARAAQERRADPWQRGGGGGGGEGGKRAEAVSVEATKEEKAEVKAAPTAPRSLGERQKELEARIRRG